MSARLRGAVRSVRGRPRAPAAGALAVLVVVGIAIAARAADPSAIWRIVHNQCVPDQRAHDKPAPCASVDLSGGEANGVAILKDINGIAQYLAIPTRRVAGIESPEILDAASPDYWRAAWAARSFLNASLALKAHLSGQLPREAIGLAINAVSRRSQDQFHIHIDCVAPDVRAALGAWRDKLTADWRILPFPLAGRRYWARRLDSPDLADAAPFRLLADGLAGAKDDMAGETLVVIGATFEPGQPGFVMLADRADPAGGGGHGEDLLDATCAVAAAPR